MQDSTGNWNNTCRVALSHLPLSDSSPLTDSLIAAAERAAAAASFAGGAESPAAAAAEKAAAEEELAQQTDGARNVWWPRFATDEEMEDLKPHGVRLRCLLCKAWRYLHYSSTKKQNSCNLIMEL